MQITDAMQLLLIGVAQGCGYALVALGFVFIYRATEIVNFAHGELMMLGAFAGLTSPRSGAWASGLALPLAVCHWGSLAICLMLRSCAA